MVWSVNRTPEENEGPSFYLPSVTSAIITFTRPYGAFRFTACRFFMPALPLTQMLSRAQRNSTIGSKIEVHVC